MHIYGSETLKAILRGRLLDPDVADIKLYGLSGGTLPGKGGDRRGYHKSADRKARSRRFLKRRARYMGKILVWKEFYDSIFDFDMEEEEAEAFFAEKEDPWDWFPSYKES